MQECCLLHSHLVHNFLACSRLDVSYVAPKCTASCSKCMSVNWRANLEVHVCSNSITRGLNLH